MAVWPLTDEWESIWITCWKVDYRVYSDVLRLCNEKVFVNLEALAFGANAEFDDIRPVALSISQTTSSLLKREISLLIECGDFLFSQLVP